MIAINKDTPSKYYVVLLDFSWRNAGKELSAPYIKGFCLCASWTCVQCFLVKKKYTPNETQFIIVLIQGCPSAIKTANKEKRRKLTRLIVYFRFSPIFGHWFLYTCCLYNLLYLSLCQAFICLDETMWYACEMPFHNLRVFFYHDRYFVLSYW